MSRTCNKCKNLFKPNLKKFSCDDCVKLKKKNDNAKRTSNKKAEVYCFICGDMKISGLMVFSCLECQKETNRNLKLVYHQCGSDIGELSVKDFHKANKAWWFRSNNCIQWWDHEDVPDAFDVYVETLIRECLYHHQPVLMRLKRQGLFPIKCKMDWC